MSEQTDEPVFVVKIMGLLHREDIERYQHEFSEKLPGRVVVIDGRVDDIYKMTRLDIEKLVAMIEEVDE